MTSNDENLPPWARGSRWSENQRQRLARRSQRFLGRCDWIGADSLTIDENLCRRIATEACLMTLELEADLLDSVNTVILYPGAFVVDDEWTDEDGIVHQGRDIRSGEAWDRGPVVLARDEIVSPPMGSSLVIHEFAHRLDALNGVMNGFPPLRPPQSARRWNEVFSRAFDDIRRRVETGAELRIDDYAAENPAECFAVFSEAFFVTPDILATDYPAVAEQLREFYRQDLRQSTSEVAT